MYTAERIQERIKVRPFVPMRIFTSAGTYYDIYHPDLAVVGKQLVFVGAASKDNPTMFDKSSTISILHITAIEDLPVGTASQSSESNGQ
jgi:hypothetical protein